MRRLLMLALCFLPGCAEVRKQAVKDQAAFDLSCPADKVEVVFLTQDGRNAELDACGKRVKYHDLATLNDNGYSWTRVLEPEGAQK